MRTTVIHPSGTSILELIVSMAILVTVIIAVLALTTSNLVGQHASEQQVVASNLARESIEVIRSIRDSNWLAGRAWDTGIRPSGASGAFGVTTFFPNFSPGDWRFNLMIFGSQVDFTPMYLYEGFYTHITTGEPTPFRRSVSLQSICQRADGSEGFGDPFTGGCGALGTKIGAEVRVDVNWEEKGRTRTVRLIEHLYAWK